MIPLTTVFLDLDRKLYLEDIQVNFGNRDKCLSKYNVYLFQIILFINLQMTLNNYIY